MGNPDECSDHKIIEKPNSCYGFDLDGKFCDVLCLLKQKYPHIKDMKDIYWSNVLTERFSILHKNKTYEDTRL